jgi:drug/metabolite transporter (DMT)-like permease
VVVVFLGWWLLDEVFTPQQFAASALVLCGVLLCREAPAAPAAIPPGGPKP